MSAEAVAAAAWRAGFRETVRVHTGDGDFGALTVAIAVAIAESGGDATAVNAKSGATGAWQILPSAHPEYDAAKLKDLDYNAAAAFAISHGGTDWGAWEAFTNGMWSFNVAVASPLAVTSPPAGQNPLQVVAGLPAAIASEVLGLDGIAKSILRAGLVLVFSIAALGLIAMGLSRLTDRNPADLYRKVSGALPGLGAVKAAAVL